MPWNGSKDVAKHIKGLNTSQKKAWLKIANKVLSQTGSDAKAIRIANAKAKQVTR